MGKMFFIGMNKTATTYLREYLINKHNIYTQHYDNWDIHNNEYNAFLDGYHENFSLYDQLIPNSIFVVQTRCIKQWLTSCIKHEYKFHNKIYNIDNVLHDKLRSLWVKKSKLHKKIIDYFTNGNNCRCYVININKESFTNKIDEIVVKHNIKKHHKKIFWQNDEIGNNSIPLDYNFEYFKNIKDYIDKFVNSLSLDVENHEHLLYKGFKLNEIVNINSIDFTL